MRIGLSYSKLDIDNNLSIDTSIPSGYAQKDIKDIIKEYF